MWILLRVLLNGFLLATVLPGIFPDIKFHGDFWPQGVVAGLLFAMVVWLVEVLLATLGILTLGVVFVLRFVLWFLIPALQLYAMAHWFPQYLTIGSAQSDILGGFVLMIVNIVTGSSATTGAKKKKHKDE